MVVVTSHKRLVDQCVRHEDMPEMDFELSLRCTGRIQSMARSVRQPAATASPPPPPRPTSTLPPTQQPPPLLLFNRTVQAYTVPISAVAVLERV